MPDLNFGQQLAMESIKLLESNLVSEIHRRVNKPVALAAQRAIEQATAAVIQHIVSPPEAPQRVKS